MAHERRRPTPIDVETDVLMKSARRCALCYHLSGDLSEKFGQIAHLDGDRSNSLADNLAFICFDHHSLFDSTTSQHKNYTLPEVKAARAKLHEAIAERRHFGAASVPRQADVADKMRADLKIAAIHRLHERLVKGHYEINRRAKARMPKTEAEFRTEVEIHEFNFLDAFTMASLYLDATTQDVMKEVLGSFRQMCTSIWLRLPEIYEKKGQYEDADIREPDWRLFRTTFDQAIAALKKLLDPSEVTA